MPSKMPPLPAPWWLMGKLFLDDKEPPPGDDRIVKPLVDPVDFATLGGLGLAAKGVGALRGAGAAAGTAADAAGDMMGTISGNIAKSAAEETAATEAALAKHDPLMLHRWNNRGNYPLSPEEEDWIGHLIDHERRSKK